MLYDISPTLHPGFPVWPGDAPFEVAASASLSAGDPVNLSRLSTTPHLGSHADAPCHTEAGGAGIGDLDLTPFLGPCRVAAVPPAPLIEPHHLRGRDPARPPRLLLKTGSVPDRERFHQRFSAVSPALAATLAESGTLLVGTDTPSVDPWESKTLDAHHALLGNGVAILEGLLLDGVPEGLYELIALPLKLSGVDGSPVRAVLRTLPD